MKVICDAEKLLKYIDQSIQEEKKNIEYVNGWTVAEIMYHKGRIDAYHDVMDLVYRKQVEGSGG